jgi:hypothetical protein
MPVHSAEKLESPLKDLFLQKIFEQKKDIFTPKKYQNVGFVAFFWVGKKGYEKKNGFLAYDVSLWHWQTRLL